MIVRKTSLSLAMLLVSHWLFAQCSCTDCPFQVPDNTTVSSTIDISGLVNGTLGANGQDICEIRVHFDTDAIEELEIQLLPPTGQSVLLIDRVSGIGINQNLNFDISFLPCSQTPTPDAGYPAGFDANAYDLVNNQNFTGSYYPTPPACLETLSGDANGTYTLVFTDFVGGDPHTVLDWEIIFCDGTGLSCSPAASCDPGDLQTVASQVITACEGSPDLSTTGLNLSPSWLGPAPDPSLYGVTYFVSNFNTGIVIERTDTPDLTGYSPGEYRVCGLSYLLSDAANLPSTTGGYTIPSVEQDIANDVFCGDLSDFCSLVSIIAQPPDPVLDWPTPPEICENQLYVIDHVNYDPNLQYSISVNSGSFNQFGFDGNGDFVIDANAGVPIDICIGVTGPCTVTPSCTNLTVVPAPPVPTLSAPTSICTGEDATVTVTNAQPGDTYAWTINGPGTLITNNNDEIEVTGNSAGTMEVCAELTNGCGSTEECVFIGIIDDFPGPTIDWPVPAEICEGVAYQFPITDFDASYNYQDVITSGNFSIVGVNFATGTYDITASDNAPIDLCVTIDGDCNPTQSCVNLTVLPAPTLPVLSAPGGVCTGDGGMVTVTNTQPGDMYSWTINGPGTITADNGDNIDFTTSSAGTVEFCVDITNSCGTIQQCITVVVSDPVPPSTNAQATYCLPTNFFAGNANGFSTSILWEQISGPGTITFVNPNVVATQWTADLSGTYVVRLTKELNGCITFEEVTIELLPTSPAPILTGPFTFCDNVTSNVSVTNPQANTSYTWTITGPGILTSLNGDNVDVEITGNGTIDVCVESVNQCGTFTDCWSADAVIPIPATANAAPTYCFPGGTFNGSINGSSNQIEYTQISGPGTITFTSPLSITTDWTVDLPGVYTVELFKNFFDCDTIEVFTFEVIEGPTANEVVTCSNGQFTIEVTFSGGAAPYFVDGTAIVGSEYTSPPYSSGTAVTIDYEDSNGCGDILSIQEFCQCTTDAGSMAGSLIELCDANGVAAGIYNNDATLDADDVGQYVLHTGAGGALGIILDINQNGVFAFQPGMTVGTTYYISYIAGNDDGTGAVDLSDICLSVALGQPVVWYPNVLIDVVVESDPLACDQSLILEAIYNLPNGLSPFTAWSNTTAPSGGLVILSSLTNDVTTATFTESGQYTLRFQLDLGPCVYSDEIVINVDPAFIVDAETVLCDPTDGTYTVSFDINGGVSPYIVNGTPINGTTFTSGPVIIGTPYSYIVETSDNCPPVTVFGTDNCGCISDAGTMPVGPQTVCSDQITTATVNGATLDNNDIGVYILHDAAGTTLGTILEENTTGTFSFIAGMNTGQSYYISYVVGNDAGGTVDLNDVCLSVAVGTEVVWIDYPSLDIGADFSTCGPSDIIDVFTDPGATMTWAYSATSPQTDGVLDDSAPLSLVFSSGSTGIHQLAATASIAGCTTTETIDIEVFSQGDLINLSENCSGTTYTVSFDIVGGTSPYLVDGVAVTGDQYESGAINSGDSYAFTVTDSNGCVLGEPAGSRNCDCVSDAGTITAPAIRICDTIESITVLSDGNATLESDDAGIYVLHDLPRSTLGTVIGQSLTGTFGFAAPMQTGTTYYISYVVGDSLVSSSVDFSDPCLDITVGIPVTWYAAFDLLYADSITQCFNELRLDNLNGVQGLTTDLRIILGPGNATLVRADSLGQEYVFDEAGDYVLEVRNSRDVCLDIDTINLTLLQPLDLSVYRDIDTCASFVTLPSVLDGQQLSFSSSDSNISITSIGDSILIASNSAGGATIAIEGPSFFCQDRDTFQVSFQPELRFSNIQYNCNADGTLAAVEVTLTGGDGNYIVNGQSSNNPTIVLTGVDPTQPFVINASSGICPTIITTIDIDCGCSNTPANLAPQALLLCEEEVISSSFVDVGQAGPDDTLLVLFHDGGSTSIGTIFAINDTPDFVLDAAITYPDTLWMTAFIGPLDADGSPMLDNSCAVLGIAQPIVRVPELVVGLSLPPFLCVDETGSLLLAAEGQYPITLEVLVNGSSSTYAITDDQPIVIPLSPADSIDLQILVTAIDYPCSSSPATSSVTVLSCDCITYSYQVPQGVCYDGQDINLQAWEQNNRAATYTLVSGDASVNGSNVTIGATYEGAVTIHATPTAADACDSVYRLTFEVEQAAEIVLKQNTLALCPEDQQIINLDQYVFTASPIGSWSVGPNIEIADLPVGTTNTTYTIAARDYCPSISEDFTIDLNPPLDYVITSTDPDCQDFLGSIAISLSDSTLLSGITLDGSVLSDDIITDLAPGGYAVVLTDVNNCIYGEDVEIAAVTPIEVSISGDLDVVEGNAYSVRSTVIGGIGNYTYQWSVAGDTLPVNTDIISIQIDENTEVQLLVTDENGCQAEDIIVLRLQSETIDWVMPNVFNPESSTKNKVSIPQNTDIIQVLTWNIYDRWGNLVFAAGSYDPLVTEVGWTGDFRGTAVANGVYVYYIQYLDSRGQRQIMSGDITVAR